MHMQKIDALLINPISARTIPAFVPHGLLYIASFAIEKGFHIKIYDRNVENKGLKEVLSELGPRVVGLGCLTGSCIDDAIYVSREIRRFDPSIKIVWGGIHASLYPDSVLREDFVDFVVIGDGEAAFAGIITKIMKNNVSLESIDNLGYKEEGQIRYNQTSFTDMSSLPQPAWHLIEVKKYIRSKFYANRVLTINTSRGCPYKCSFCCVPKVHNGKWRGIDAEKIIENLKFLKRAYSIDCFQVDDDEFEIDKERVLKLCRLLRSNSLNLKWSHFSRINIVNEDILREEVACGLRLIEFGVESGSARMLKFLNKGQTVEQIIKAYAICKRLRIKTSALFMVGLPAEELSDLNDTVKLIKQLNPHLTICTIFRPYPGTELFDYCIEKKIFSFSDKLDGIGRLYNQDLNVSPIQNELILKIKRSFDANNIYQEIKLILTRLKLRLLFYYIYNYIIRPRLKGLRA